MFSSPLVQSTVCFSTGSIAVCSMHRCRGSSCTAQVTDCQKSLTALALVVWGPCEVGMFTVRKKVGSEFPVWVYCYFWKIANSFCFHCLLILVWCVDLQTLEPFGTKCHRYEMHIVMLKAPNVACW